MRTAGYEVLCECLGTDGPVAIIQVLSEDKKIQHAVSARELAAALGTTADELAAMEFIAVLRETPQTAQVLSGFRPMPGVNLEET